MTLTLRVTSYRGAPPSTPLAAKFDEQGGSIGRSPDNRFCLPDTDKLVSRSHATVKYRSGQFHILDHGGNALIHNGRSLGDGREAVLADGDELVVGEYRVNVSLADSHANLPEPPHVALLSANANFDHDDFPSSEPLSDLPSGNLGYDPFDPDEILPPANSKPRSRPTPNVGASARNDLPGHAHPIPTTMTKKRPIETPDYDPWNDKLNSAEPDVHEEIAVPEPVEVIPKNTELPGNGPKPPSIHGLAQGHAAPGKGMPESRVDTGRPRAIGSQGMAFKSLLLGLGLTNLEIPDDQVERVAEMLGAMLREALEGTMELLRARAIVKRENRMDPTMIGSLENNPLKFFPNVDEALLTMLTRNSNAYVSPLAAVGEAFDDMRAHEVATITGMRVAFGELLKRFDPQLIERQEEARSMDSVVPALKKARMWDRMNVAYRDVVRESEDNFEKVFGDSFSRAYSDQVRRVRSSAQRNTRR
jgi:type VI secretion system FHA domain protein